MCLCFSSAIKFRGWKTASPINITITILVKNIARKIKLTVSKQDPFQNINLVSYSLELTYIYTHSETNILTSQLFYLCIITVIYYDIYIFIQLILSILRVLSVCFINVFSCLLILTVLQNYFMKGLCAVCISTWHKQNWWFTLKIHLLFETVES